MADLHRLAKTHFVCQDAIEAIIVQADHPLQAHELVLPQLRSARSPQHGRLGFDDLVNAVC